ncbi:MAG TPA: hypothetical protein PKE26_01425 [Kiritimatiellia bacterium]|nr:hypothetical protein [Kiritimatiellia bacterium]HMO97753.1 hypothetical protein [Kiritimatiellia bacterium]HMP95392.1 hypothetical protein [Kiritimatiellia bacterium]
MIPARWLALALTLCLFAAMLPVEVVQAQPAQRNPISIRKVDGGKAPTPVFQVRGSQSQGRSKDWFRVFVEYDSEPDWIDELSFTFYVLVRGKSKDAPPVTLFKGETAYIHIPSGKRHQADMYLHPNIIARFGDVAQVAVEVREGGRVLARTGKPEPTEAWWERITPVAGVLLDRGQTPFALVDIDDQEIIKPR